MYLSMHKSIVQWAIYEIRLDVNIHRPDSLSVDLLIGSGTTVSKIRIK